MEKRLSSDRNVVLSADPEFAMRIGRRRDPKPVLLEVQTSAARRRNSSFTVFGDLYLTKEIPADCISGPPVEEEPVVRKSEKPKEEKPGFNKADFMPGSFLLDIRRDPAPHRGLKGKKGKSWKEEARKVRKRRNE
jgi:putative RNA 2'-phosphotransferase